MGRGGPFLSTGTGGRLSLSACEAGVCGRLGVAANERTYSTAAVQRRAQRFRVVGEEGDQGAALMSGDQRDREVARIGVRPQIAAAPHLG